MLLKTQTLIPEVLNIVRDKETEHAFTGEYDVWEKPGSFLCRQCGLALFRSYSKFQSGCGWPSFDEEIPGAITRHLDFDGQRTEILCQRCQAHLGHVFQGEQFTPKNIRHCVNSLSLDFVDDMKVLDTEEGLFAAGCFWGVEYYFKQLPGVLKVESGYCGGHLLHPSYQQVCAGNTGHIETVRVLYDPNQLSYEKLTQYFFEIHDPEQADGQGPDRGEQYLSVIFYLDNIQQKIAQNLIEVLFQKGYHVSTKVRPAAVFWRAEDYHQNYYQKMNKLPYCHVYTKRF